MPPCCAGSARARRGLTCMLCVCTLCACAARVRVCLQDHGGLPLHVAAWKNASERVVQALLDAHPRGAKATCVSSNGAGVGARACVVWGGAHPLCVLWPRAQLGYTPKACAEGSGQTPAVIALLSQYEQLGEPSAWHAVEPIQPARPIQAQPARPQGYILASWLEGAWTSASDCFTTMNETVHARSDDEFEMRLSGGACPCGEHGLIFYRDESIGVVNVFRTMVNPGQGYVVRIKLVDENTMEKGPQTEYPLFAYGPATKTSPSNHKASQSTSMAPQPQMMASRA